MGKGLLDTRVVKHTAVRDLVGMEVKPKVPNSKAKMHGPGGHGAQVCGEPRVRAGWVEKGTGAPQS